MFGFSVAVVAASDRVNDTTSLLSGSRDHWFGCDSPDSYYGSSTV